MYLVYNCCNLNEIKLKIEYIYLITKWYIALSKICIGLRFVTDNSLNSIQLSDNIIL